MIFRKLFGGGNKPPEKSWQEQEAERQAAREIAAQQKSVERRGKLDAAIRANEPVMPDRSSPEANEAPRTVKAHQFKYGKHVVAPDGPIDGRDYHLTVAPENLALTGMKFLSGEYSFGVSDLSRWEKMPHVPIVKIARIIDGKPYVICGLVWARPEAGTGKSGRRYQEAHYLVIPAEEWSVALVPQLTKLLNDTPRVIGEPLTTAEIEVDTGVLDGPLPDGWLENAKDILVRIAGGQTMSIQNWDPPEKEKFMQNMFYALVCLPERVARRISFGSGIGFDGVQDGKVGLRAFLGVSGFAYDRSLKIKDQPWKNDNAERLDLGQRYLSALSPLISSAKTPREVMKAVLQLPKELTDEIEKKIFG